MVVSRSGDGGRSLDAFEQEARALVERRRYQQAQVAVAHGLQQYPDSTELQYLAAFIDNACQRPEKAMQGIKALLLQAPDHVGARMLYAALLEHARQLPEAERVWIELLREYPQRADCYAGYAALMLETLNLDKARRLVAEGLRQSPTHPGCLYYAALIDLIGGRSGAHSETLQRMLHEHPEHVNSAIALIIALADRGDNRGALRIAQELLRSQPESASRLKLVRDLKARSHWTMLPLYPIQRWGWSASITISVIAIVGLQVGGKFLSPVAADVLVFGWLAYVIYSWVWPKVLRRLV